MHCIQIKILFHQNLKLSMILLKMLLGKDMGPDSSYKKGKVGFDVKVMNMMFSIKTIFIPQYFMISTEIMV